MPEVRSSAWSAVQSFPAPDGSRTLRVAVANDVVDALQSRQLQGIRQSFLWACHKGLRRLTTETEVLTAAQKWIKLVEWQLYRGSGNVPGSARTGSDFNSYESTTTSACNSRGSSCAASGVGHTQSPCRAASSTSIDDYRLPRLVIDHLKCGRIISVKQSLLADVSVASGIKADVVVESTTPRGDIQKESLKEYMARESAAVEMCVPLSSEEADAFFNGGTVTGIRHSWRSNLEADQQHSVEVCIDDYWTPLVSNEVFVWSKVVTPHFRFIFTSPDRRKDNINSATPWVQ